MDPASQRVFLRGRVTRRASWAPAGTEVFGHPAAFA